jgi:hypothetical protein
MSLLSKSEVQYLLGKKQLSKFYEYKLKSVIKKKLANLIDKELPLLYSFNVGLDLTEFGRNLNINITTSDLTKNGKDASPILPLDQNQ